LSFPNVTYAQETGEFPYAPEQVFEFPDGFIKLDLMEYEFVEELEQVYVYSAVYKLPYRLPTNVIHDHFFYFRYYYNYPYGSFIRSQSNIRNSAFHSLTRRFSDYTLLDY